MMLGSMPENTEKKPWKKKRVISSFRPFRRIFTDDRPANFVGTFKAGGA